MYQKIIAGLTIVAALGFPLALTDASEIETSRAKTPEVAVKFEAEIPEVARHVQETTPIVITATPKKQHAALPQTVKASVWKCGPPRGLDSDETATVRVCGWAP